MPLAHPSLVRRVVGQTGMGLPQMTDVRPVAPATGKQVSGERKPERQSGGGW